MIIKDLGTQLISGKTDTKVLYLADEVGWFVVDSIGPEDYGSMTWYNLDRIRFWSVGNFNTRGTVSIWW